MSAATIDGSSESPQINRCEPRRQRSPDRQIGGPSSSSGNADVTLARMFRQARDLDADDLKILDDMVRSLLKRRKESREGK